jgi:Zn-finger nucleic acid-binding protein
MAECDKCGAPLRLDRKTGLLVCDHCGSQNEPPAGGEYLEVLEKTSIVCPLCSIPLSNGRLDDFRVACCERCYGMLIEMGIFAMVIDAMRAHQLSSLRIALPPRQRPGDRIIKCPRCAQPMLSQFYAGPGNVVIDSCEHCEVNWLDGGELRRIAAAPDSPHSV